MLLKCILIRADCPQWNTDTLRSRTDRVAMGKYDRTEEQDMQLVERVHELAQRYGVKMQQIALEVKLTAEDVAYLEEPYMPHRIVGAIYHNPAEGVILLDEKK